MKMERTPNERQVLKRFLSRYFRATEKKAVLEGRLSRMQAELRRPGGGEVSSGIAEIEDRLHRQAASAEKCALEIMDVLELLPADSTERTILELRHLDCKPWKDIHRAVYLTRSPCFEHYNKGLDQLLTMPEVRRKLNLKNGTGG